MKKFIYLALLCVILSATSCSKYDFETTDLIGTWEKVIELETSTLYDRLIFEANGKVTVEYLGYVHDKEGTKSNVTRDDNDFPEGVLDSDIDYGGITSGTYVLDKDILYLSDIFFKEEPTTIAYKISIKKNTLKLTNLEELEKMKRKYVTTKTYTKIE